MPAMTLDTELQGSPISLYIRIQRYVINNGNSVRAYLEIFLGASAPVEGQITVPAAGMLPEIVDFEYAGGNLHDEAFAAAMALPDFATAVLVA